MPRPDGSAASALRSVEMIPNFHRPSEGSVLYRAGGTVVLCTASVDDKVPSFLEGKGQGWVTAEYQMHPRANPVFVWRSARHNSPVLDLNLLRSRVLSSASVSALLYFASFGILLLSSVLWLQDHWHYSAIKTGLSIAPGPCSVPFFAVLSEVLAKRIRVGTIAAGGCLLSAVGAVLLVSSLGTSPHYLADFLPGWLLVCIGCYLFLVRERYALR